MTRFAEKFGHGVTGHEFEDSALSLLKQVDDLIKTPSHRFLISVGADHSTVEAVTKRMIDVEL